MRHITIAPARDTAMREFILIVALVLSVPCSAQVLNPPPSPEGIRSYMMYLPPKLRDQMVSEKLVESKICVGETIHSYAAYNFSTKAVAQLVQNCVALLGATFYGAGRTSAEYNETVRVMVKSSLMFEFGLSVDEVERRFYGIGLWPLRQEDAQPN